MSDPTEYINKLEKHIESLEGLLRTNMPSIMICREIQGMDRDYYIGVKKIAHIKYDFSNMNGFRYCLVFTSDTKSYEFWTAENAEQALRSSFYGIPDYVNIVDAYHDKDDFGH